ncbi:hypothetical protein LCGC14_1013820 [marine sediment metagenome]|uniref:ParB/Sulfiredoxin domain-containing protein n=1 Tax=marine sediment metagenome TaxID=412755 RepID=A0A0F9MZG7_9ZZZZ|nr:hypothetical protein [Candidatus Aminicenantes bacterium]
MAEPAIDLTGLPPADDDLDLIGLPTEDDDKDLRSYVESVVGPGRTLPEAQLVQGTAPSFIKRVWRLMTEPDWEKRRTQSLISLQLAEEKGVHVSQVEPPGLFETAKQGFNQSVAGLMIRLAYDDKGYDTIAKEAYDRMGNAQRILYQAAMVAGDIPFFIVGATIGAGGGPVTAVGGAFALPAGLRKVYSDKLEKGEVTSFKDFWQRLTWAVWETLKGEATGIAVGTAGPAAGVYKLPAEIVTMTTVGAALEGRMPEPQEFMDTAIIIGGLRLSSRVVPALHNVYKKTGKRPLQVLKDIETDPTIKEDILERAENPEKVTKKRIIDIDPDYDRRARSIVKLHGIVDVEKFDALFKRFQETEEWNGRPLLIWDVENERQALTGSHRLQAAQDLDFQEVPVVEVNNAKMRPWLDKGNTFDDLMSLDEHGKMELFRELGDNKAADLMLAEIEANARGFELLGDLPKSYEHLREESPISEAEETAATKQRKFIKTVEEAEKTDPALVGKVKEIDPQEYIVEPNVESLGKAEKRIETEGLEKTIDYVLSDADLNAEKGATFITLMEKFQKEGDIERALQMVENYDQQLREAGRFIQAASIWTKTSPAGFIRWAEKQLEATRGKFGWLDTLFKRKPESFTLSPEKKAKIMARITEIQSMPEGAEKTNAMLGVVDEVAQLVPPSISELIDAYRYQNMLSSPRTQMRNIGENLMNTFLTKPIDVTTRGAIDFVKAGLFGKERQAYISDVPLYMKTAINAVPNAINAFMSVMRLEKGVEIGKPDIGLDVKSEFQRARMAQMPKPLTVVSRFMEASDKFFSALIGAGEFAIQKKQGASDAQAYAMASELSQKYLYREKLNPSDPDLSYFSKVLVSLGKMMNDSRQLPALGPIMKWAVPFIRTPINKGAQMIERSPLALFRGKISQETAAKLVGGSLVTALGALFAMTGQTTWAPPSDREEKNWFYASGRKPFSFQIGEKWIPIWYLGPFALAFGLPAAIKHYTQDEKTALSKDYIEKTLAVLEGTVRFLGSQTSTQSIGALFSALSGDIDFTFPSTVAFTGGQIIPAQSLIRYLNTMIDPVYRKPKGFWENIIKDIPIMSKELEPRFDPFMQESKRESLNFFVPYDIGRVKPEFEEGFQSIRIQKRFDFLKNRMDRTIRGVQKGTIKPEKMPKELDKAIKGMNKIEIAE